MESITIDIWKLVMWFIASMGIPSAITGLIVWRLERRIAKREKNAEDKEKSRENLLLMLVQSTGASIALGEATAKAVQRIPDAHCNGDMHDALAYAAKVKHEQKDFLSAQGIHAIF